MGLSFCASQASANGGIYPAIGLPTDVSIPAQEALVIHDGSQEVLILQIRFSAEGDSFGWVIPVPAMPHVEVADPGLFPALQVLTEPRVMTSDRVILGVMLMAVLVLSFPAFALKKAIRPWIISMIIAGFLVFFVGPCFMTMRAARKATLGGSYSEIPAVTIHETGKVGPYDVTLLSSSESHQLRAWFGQNGFSLPDGAIPVLDEYIRKNWYFVASKLSSEDGKGSAEHSPVPLKLTFAVDQAVYPMKLTSLSSVESGVLLYILDDEFCRARHLRIEDAKELTDYEQAVLERRSGEGLSGLDIPHLTRLFGSLSPSEMRNDAAIVSSRDQRERHSTVYTRRARRFALVGVLASLACMVAGLIIPNRLGKKVMFTLLACGLVALVRPWGVFAPYSRSYEETRRRGSVGSNIYALESALDEFASMARGHYPADLNTTVMEVLEQLGIDSDNDTSLTGASGSKANLEGEVGSTGPALLSESMVNPYSGHNLVSLIVETSEADTPAFSMPGILHYVPLDVDGRIASGYRIYGETKRGFSDRVAQTSHWRAVPKAMERNGKWGYVGRRDRIVVEPQFDWAGKFSEGLAPVMLKERWGYADERGNLVIEAQFDSAAQFSDGMAAVRIGQVWGYIDKMGKTVITPFFHEAGPFLEGLAAVRVGALWGFVERSGDMLVEPRYTDVDRFSEGFAAVKTGGKWGYVDRTGEVTIRPIFDKAGRFSRGHASVRVGARGGVIDASGRLIEPLE
jgi:hypothetical protein